MNIYLFFNGHANVTGNAGPLLLQMTRDQSDDVIVSHGNYYATKHESNNQQDAREDGEYWSRRV